MKINPEERELKARAYFKEGYNCTQSVVMAFADVLGLDESRAAILASGFGGGMGRLREVCGAFSGAVLLSGTISVKDPSDRIQRKDNYALVQKFADSFSRNFGSIVCRDLLQKRSQEREGPSPSERNEGWYASRPCENLVGFCAAMVARHILEAE